MSRARALPWWMGLAGGAGAALVWMLGRSWRVEWVEGEGGSAPGGQPDRPCIMAFWHARMLPLAYAYRGSGCRVLVSRHHDGELIARVIHRLGFLTARGSSTRGGEEAMRELLPWAREGGCLGLTPDGPRGPAERVKPGVLYLASRSGLPIVPVTAAASSTWVLRSWDRFRVPRPFARVVVAHGAPLRVPPDLGREALEGWCGRLEAALAAVTERAARRAGERP